MISWQMEAMEFSTPWIRKMASYLSQSHENPTTSRAQRQFGLKKDPSVLYFLPYRRHSHHSMQINWWWEVGKRKLPAGTE